MNLGLMQVITLFGVGLDEIFFEICKCGVCMSVVLQNFC